MILFSSATDAFLLSNIIIFLRGIGCILLGISLYYIIKMFGHMQIVSLEINLAIANKQPINVTPFKFKYHTPVFYFIWGLFFITLK